MGLKSRTKCEIRERQTVTLTALDGYYFCLTGMEKWIELKKKKIIIITGTWNEKLNFADDNDFWNDLSSEMFKRIVLFLKVRKNRKRWLFAVAGNDEILWWWQVLVWMLCLGNGNMKCGGLLDSTCEGRLVLRWLGF